MLPPIKKAAVQDNSSQEYMPPNAQAGLNLLGLSAGGYGGYQAGKQATPDIKRFLRKNMIAQGLGSDATRSGLRRIDAHAAKWARRSGAAAGVGLSALALLPLLNWLVQNPRPKPPQTTIAISPRPMQRLRTPAQS
jgi:hypothetical protein